MGHMFDQGEGDAEFERVIGLLDVDKITSNISHVNYVVFLLIYIEIIFVETTFQNNKKWPKKQNKRNQSLYRMKLYYAMNLIP